MRRHICFSGLLAAGLILAALSPACAAARAPYLLTAQNGFLCVLSAAERRPVLETRIPLSSLSARDRLLLESGIPLHDRAEYTTALEDFCS